MEIIIVIIAAIVGVGVVGLLFVTRRLMRLAIRLALAGGLLLVLLAGGLAWWYRSDVSDSRQKEKPATTRRANSR